MIAAPMRPIGLANLALIPLKYRRTTAIANRAAMLPSQSTLPSSMRHPIEREKCRRRGTPCVLKMNGESRSVTMAIGNGEYGVEPSRHDSGRRAWWWVDGLPGFLDPKAASFLLALVPQLEGSPALQSLFMGLFLVASGTASSLLNTMLRAVIRRN